ncbi:RNA polymerase sigma factor (TIGR02999 family) [Tahibacter aquaticus]|jgi:RNA polymerase sigma factor (TIGR02999 family)|uniref:RNA polymerase sigma factor (TIGR02999 family) n=1 Tax=Tahibacter aquaticus TaxID=520092 RepID=A0A4R6YWD9_9GAMM|nr:ECF-type sigma factor [Tahibacter aquaticus]TDR43133.1 RNA polymerase sigma factor (TIGR02999 family) [Tahibacter aquaticus]
MLASPPQQITQLLRAWEAGDGVARESVVNLVYDHVRAIAACSLRHAPGATLTPTEIAHEALLRILGAEAGWQDRRHFFHVIAQATRQILVDAARRRHADKRGGAVERIDIAEAAEQIASADSDAQLLRIDAALAELGRSDQRRARTIELVYFGGYSRAEIAATLDVSEGTVDRDLRLARAWLKVAIEA